MNYSDYIKSEHWRLLRGAKLQITPACQHCGSRDEIEVHHKTYRRIFSDGKVGDLETLCRTCHLKEHAKNWQHDHQAKADHHLDGRIKKLSEWLSRATARCQTPKQKLEARRAKLKRLVALRDSECKPRHFVWQ